MQKRLLFLLFIFLFPFSNQAQQPKKLNASEIYESIQKLNFLGSALYIAAHPDDENTRLISYLSNEVKARTGYLALTRGDGGQNLIGPEISELLGVIRTQELLEARKIDGGEQFFTRANDFGFSKHPDETLAIWNKENNEDWAKILDVNPLPESIDFFAKAAYVNVDSLNKITAAIEKEFQNQIADSSCCLFNTSV